MEEINQKLKTTLFFVLKFLPIGDWSSEWTYGVIGVLVLVNSRMWELRLYE